MGESQLVAAASEVRPDDQEILYPQGLRARRQPMNQPVHEHSNVLPSVIDLAWLWATARRDVLLLGAVFALGILLTGHAMFKFLAVGPSEPWRQARCRQC